MSRYRRELEAARRRLAARQRHSIHARYGSIEYAEQGVGPPLLFSYLLFGGFDLGLGTADAYLGDGFRVIAPSQFGYLGSSLQAGATPADQADAYAVLLDALGVERTAVVGCSAGGSDLVLWRLKAYLPSLYARLLGMPKGFRPTPEERCTILEAQESLFPLPPRKRGVLFDLYVSNPDVQGYPLETISVPTLIVNAKDDGLSAVENAIQASGRVSGSKLVVVDRGGHLLLGSETRIQEEIAPLGRSEGLVEGVDLPV
jgi:pimeloyl-ACP methyl ester carboxylesterase